MLFRDTQHSGAYYLHQASRSYCLTRHCTTWRLSKTGFWCFNFSFRFGNRIIVDTTELLKKHYLNFWTKSIGPFNTHTPYWRCFYNVFYTYDELYYEDFTSATWELCYPCWTFTVKLHNCWTFTVKLHNCGCSYCVATGCSQDRKEAQQQQQRITVEFGMPRNIKTWD